MIPQKWDQPATFSGVAVLHIAGQQHHNQLVSFVSRVSINLLMLTLLVTVRKTGEFVVALSSSTY